MSSIQPVILSGGSGTRLWPLSREAYPKQFLPLAGELTMLQATWKRVAPIAARGPLVIANEEHRFVAAEQLQQVGAEPAAIILESAAIRPRRGGRAGGHPRRCRRPAAGAALRSRDHQRDCVPQRRAGGRRCRGRQAGDLRHRADRAGNRLRLHQGRRWPGTACGRALRRSRTWIPPPATSAAASTTGTAACSCSRPRATCRLERFQPAMLAGSRQAWQQARRDADFTRLDKDAFTAVPSDSIDYAVMEDRRCGGDSTGCGLERCRFVDCAARCLAAGRRWQCPPRRRDRHRLPQYLCLRPAPGSHGRPR